MKLTFFLSILTVILFVSCARQAETTQSAELLTAQSIIDRAIEAHGGHAYERSYLQFVFRDRLYKLNRNGGSFQYERIFTQEGDSIRDILSNEGLVREINGQVVALADSFAVKYSNSVNSVHYFAQLPYGLNDAAVQKRYLGMTSLKDQDYHKVEVSFQQEGGGKDFEDVFIYWIHTESFLMDYLAYSYETDGGGLRFREAFNPQVVDGIRLQDYINYKADPNQWSVHELDQAFNEGQLTKLSEIILEHPKAL